MFGAATPGLPADRSTLGAFSQALGVAPSVALSFTSFRFGINTAALQQEVAAGLLPMVTWEPFDPTRPDVNAYPLPAIAAGTFDSYLLAQAGALRDVHSQVVLRFAHEMNASWYPWGSRVNGNTPEQYVAAYRHVHDLFRNAGISNITWLWSPTALDTSGQPDYGPLYPGDDYVDWTGLSGYFDAETDTYATSVAPSMRKLDQVAPDKPIYLAESGVLPGPDRAAKLRDLVRGVIATPRAIGLTYFDIASREDWRLDSDPIGLAALRAELRTGWFTTSTLPLPRPLVQRVPAVSGVPLVGQTLTADVGTWRTADGTTFTGRWQRCGDKATACTPTGVVGPTFLVSGADVGTHLQYAVTATGPNGSSTASSMPSRAVTRQPGAVERQEKGWTSSGGRDYWLFGLSAGAVMVIGLIAAGRNRRRRALGQRARDPRPFGQDP